MNENVILNLGGSGGASLNFTVITNPKPEAAKENTIWVDTDSIASWAFSATAPEKPEDGMVWFSVGSSSSAAFNALKRNSVMVYPLYAKQYAEGAWVDRSSEIYQDSSWVEWAQFLVRDGNAKHPVMQVRTDKSATISYLEGYIGITGLAETSLGVYFEEKVNLKSRRKIVLDADIIRAGDDATNAAFKGISVIVFRELPVSSANALYSGVVAYSITKTTGRQKITLDLGSISLDNKDYYIGIGLGYGSNTGNALNVYNFYVE